VKGEAGSEDTQKQAAPLGAGREKRKDTKPGKRKLGWKACIPARSGFIGWLICPGRVG